MAAASSWRRSPSSCGRRHRPGIPRRGAARLPRPVRHRVHRARRNVMQRARVHPRPHPGGPPVSPRQGQVDRRRGRHRQWDARRVCFSLRHGSPPVNQEIDQERREAGRDRHGHDDGNKPDGLPVLLMASLITSHLPTRPRRTSKSTAIRSATFMLVIRRSRVCRKARRNHGESHGQKG